MVRPVLAVSVLFVSLLSSAALHAQRMGASSSNSDRRVLGGTVYFPGNKPAENVSVELHSSEGTFMAPATTSASGGFEFYNLASGTYALQVNQQDYEPMDIPVDLTLTSNRGIVIYLMPIANGKAAPAHSTVSAHELSMPSKARELMESGKKKLYQDKNAQAAIDDFQQAVAVAPDYYEAHYQAAIACLILGDISSAEKSFRKSIDVSGDKYGEADIGLGKVLLDKGAAPDAEKILRHGIELNPTSSRGFYELGRAQFDERKMTDAEKSAEQARSLAPEFPSVYRLLANIHLQEKNYTALLQDIDSYIKLDPDSPAGLRAKQMRQQVQEKLAKDTPPAPGASKP
jgi:tetratricopeptide (TPR) repeat protein